MDGPVPARQWAAAPSCEATKRDDTGAGPRRSSAVIAAFRGLLGADRRIRARAAVLHVYVLADRPHLAEVTCRSIPAQWRGEGPASAGD